MSVCYRPMRVETTMYSLHDVKEIGTYVYHVTVDQQAKIGLIVLVGIPSPFPVIRPGQLY